MKEYIFKGKLESHYTMDQWGSIRLVQYDGYKIDLLHRLVEIHENHENSQFQVSYIISGSPVDEKDVERFVVSQYIGGMTTEFQSNGYAYSSWTYGTDYDSVFTIGNHDLLRELDSSLGKFIFFKIRVKDE